MDSVQRRGAPGTVLIWLLVSSALPWLAMAGDTVQDDDTAPKIPGCANNFVLVKVQTWVDGHEDAEFVGVGARFGVPIVSKEKHANRTKLSLADPADCCTPPTKVPVLPFPLFPSLQSSFPYHTHTENTDAKREKINKKKVQPKKINTVN